MKNYHSPVNFLGCTRQIGQTHEFQFTFEENIGTCNDVSADVTLIMLDTDARRADDLILASCGPLVVFATVGTKGSEQRSAANTSVLRG